MPDANQRLLAVIEIQNEIVAAKLDLDSVMQVVSERAMDLTGAGAAVVELAEGDEMVYSAVSGSAAGHLGTRLKQATSLSGLCVARGEVLSCGDASKDPRVDLAACRRVGAMAMVCVPLVHDGASVGVLKVYASTPNSFDGDDVVVLRMLSGLIAAHMSNALQLETSEHERWAAHALALSDDLTGLPNRRAWEAALARELARATRSGDPLCLAMLDLDGLKAINDTYGHKSGSDAITQAAQCWSAALRETDTIARFGGDEFAVIMPLSNLEQALAVGERLRAALVGGRTASIGMAQWNGAESGEALLERADEALYEAKRGGRNRVVGSQTSAYRQLGSSTVTALGPK